jgi:hypothetical protein
LEVRLTPSINFAAQQTFAFGSSPRSVAVADFNGDGKPDMAVANAGETRVSVSLNTTPQGAATFSFAPLQTLPEQGWAVFVAAADFNGDGRPDLVVSDGGNLATVLLNTTAVGASTASFSAGRTFAVPSATAITVADFNGDGKPDFVVSDGPGNNSVSFFLNTTPAGSDTVSFVRQDYNVGNSGPLAVADINGDGKPDLIICGCSNNAVSVLLNITPAGSNTLSFSAPKTFASNAYFVTTGDLNGDGKPDIVVTNYSPYYGEVIVLLNTTPTGAAVPSFAAAQSFAVGQNPVPAVVADVNGDGRPDLVVGNSYFGTLSVLLNTAATGATTASFTTQQTYAVNNFVVGLLAADLNGDGRPDLAFANDQATTASVIADATAAGAPLASLAVQQTFAAGNSPRPVAVGDFNGDGRPDLVIPNGGDNDVSVLLNTTPTSMANPQVVTTGQGQAKAITLTGSALHNDPITFAISANPAHGTLSGFNASTGAVTYTPNAGYSGLDSFLFTTTDTTNNSTSPAAVVSINVLPPPTANVQSVATGQGQAKAITLTGSAPNGDAYTFAETVSPARGTLSGLNTTTGAVTYTPNAGYNGADSFQFTVTDSFDGLTSTAATVSVNVLPPPTANAQARIVGAGQATTITLTGTAPIGDGLSFAVTANPSNGTLSGLNSATGQVTYTPTAGYTGPDSFQFTVTDTATTLTSSAATVTLTVGVLPTANPQSVTTAQGQAKSITITGGAPNGDAYTFAVTLNPAHGALSGFNSTTGAVTYTPSAGYAGLDSFQFTVIDSANNLTSNPAIVSINVLGPPTANAQTVAIGEGLAKVVTLTGSAPVGDAYSFAVTANPAHGTLSGFNTTTGAVTYTPNAGYTGTDSFQFSVTDTVTNLTSSPATVSVNVLPPPTANPQSRTVGTGQGTSLTLTGTAPNGDGLSFAITANPSHGTLSGLNSATGQVTYTPSASYTGPDSFQFAVIDTSTGLASAAATFTLNVVLLPTANPQTLTVLRAQVIALSGSAPNNDPLTFAILNPPAHGTLSGFSATTGQVTYTPSGSYAGLDGFSFTVTDTVTGLTSASAAVHITVPVTPVGQFGSAGVWRFNRVANTWEQLTPANATKLAEDVQGNVTAEFPGSGLWRFAPVAGWTQISAANAALLVSDAQGDLTAEFPGYGLWQYSPAGNWKQLTTVDAALLAAGGAGAVVGDFMGYGVWEFNPVGGWRQINTVDASALAMDGRGDVVANYTDMGWPSSIPRPAGCN